MLGRKPDMRSLGCIPDVGIIHELKSHMVPCSYDSDNGDRREHLERSGLLKRASGEGVHRLTTDRFTSYEVDGKGQNAMPLPRTDRMLVKVVSGPFGVALLMRSTPHAETDEPVEVQ